MTSLFDINEQTGVGQLLANVCRLVGHRRREKLKSIGLHHAQGLLLARLWQNDGMAQNILAESLKITPATATNTLKRMERDGWIERRRDAADQRVVRVYLTLKARQLQNEILTSFVELDQEMASALSAEEQKTLKSSLFKVYLYLAAEDRGCDGDSLSNEQTGETR